MKERIVAEITRNWSGSDDDADKLLISQSFEQVIKTNAAKGYDLESWQFKCLESVTCGGTPIQGIGLVETIIAVFVK